MMRCERCGTELLDTDTFCVKCGKKVTEPAVCPKCGEHLREGTRFCHKCGFLVEEQAANGEEELPVTPQKTMDIPFDMIEKSIIMEAEQAVVKRDFSEAKERMEREMAGTLQQEENPADGCETPGEAQQTEPSYQEEQRVNPIRSSRVIEAVKEGRIYMDQERISREEDEDGYEEDWDETEAEGEAEGTGSFDFAKLTMILGVVLLIILFVAAGVILKSRLAYEHEIAENLYTDQQENQEADAVNGQQEIAGKLQIIKNVNIRTQPDTQNSQILGVASVGEVYEYYGLVSDSWYHIRLSDGREAYVYKDYVTVL